MTWAVASKLTRSSMRLLVPHSPGVHSGGRLEKRAAFLRCSAHGNWSAMLANESQHSCAHVSFARHECEGVMLWATPGVTLLLMSAMQPSDLDPCNHQVKRQHPHWFAQQDYRRYTWCLCKRYWTTQRAYIGYYCTFKVVIRPDAKLRNLYTSIRPEIM